jgi:DNA topoisomerase-1
MGRGDEDGAAEARALGIDPKSGLEVALKSGRFGPYVQLGNGEKPQRSSIPKGFSLETMDLEKALRLLSLPREVGLHPETGKPIMAGFGRFGPYLSNDGAFASLETPEDVFTVGLNHAVTLLAERKAKGGRGPRGGQALKELGAHPQSGAPIKVMKGRYGPYVTDGSVNATLPRDSDPMSATLEEAVELLAARAEKGPAKKKGRAAKKAANGEKKAPAKKPAKAPVKDTAVAAAASAVKPKRKAAVKG